MNVTEYAKFNLLASGVMTSQLAVAGLGGTLREYQKAGVEYARREKRVIIADAMGVGKSCEALATIHALNAYPAVIVCPASVKYKWEREAKKWLPGVPRIVLASRALPTDQPAAARAEGQKFAATARITILNYEILEHHLKTLTEEKILSVVIDESQYIKNASAKRTKAVKQLCAGVPVRLALTGTAVLNRPAELVSQLDVIDRLKEFGGKWAFLKRYCGAYFDGYHWHYDGATNIAELNQKLRSTCYIRRETTDVLPELPPVVSSVVPFEIENRTDYQRAEDDLILWLKQQEADQSAGNLDELEKRVRRAEHLVKYEKLKLLAVQGKLHQAGQWISDFLATGEKLVVFASHREVVTGLAKQFKAPYIVGGMTALQRDTIVQAFQAGQHQLIVLNIVSGGVGLDLFAASTVAFVELDWTPSSHDQAIARCNRMGQQGSVTAYYLIARNTVEEKIATLLDAKRVVVHGVLVGKKEQEGQQHSIIRDLDRQLSGLA